MYPTFPLHSFSITQTNSKWTEASDFLSWEIPLSIFLICVQGTILDSTKPPKIITFAAILSAVFP